MADKIADGVRKKDEMLKTHHCIVAFENAEIQQKDALFVNIVNT
jgi:hypothetical protein